MNVHSLVDPWIDAVSIGAAMALAPTRRAQVDPAVLELQHAVHERDQYIAQLEAYARSRDAHILTLETELRTARSHWDKYARAYLDLRDWLNNR